MYKQINGVIEYFKNNYGRVRRYLKHFVRAQQLFSPILCDSIQLGILRTPNIVEDGKIWSGKHFGVYRIIEGIQKEQHQANIQIE